MDHKLLENHYASEHSLYNSFLSKEDQFVLRKSGGREGKHMPISAALSEQFTLRTYIFYANPCFASGLLLWKKSKVSSIAYDWFWVNLGPEYKWRGPCGIRSKFHFAIYFIYWCWQFHLMSSCIPSLIWFYIQSMTTLKSTGRKWLHFYLWILLYWILPAIKKEINSKKHH